MRTAPFAAHVIVHRGVISRGAHTRNARLEDAFMTDQPKRHARVAVMAMAAFLLLAASAEAMAC